VEELEMGEPEREEELEVEEQAVKEPQEQKMKGLADTRGAMLGQIRALKE
jgi:hypothetical protein